MNEGVTIHRYAEDFLPAFRPAPTNLSAVTHASALPAASRSRKINGASCKSGLFSVAYESAEGKFIRP
jgi:hypothetical protein